MTKLWRLPVQGGRRYSEPSRAPGFAIAPMLGVPNVITDTLITIDMSGGSSFVTLIPQYRTVGSSVWTDLASIPLVSVSYPFQGLDPITGYVLRLKAVGLNNTAYSNERTATTLATTVPAPVAPTVTTTPIDATTIRFNFAGGSGATTWVGHKRSPSGSGSYTNVSLTVAQTFIEITIANGSTADFYVTATNSVGVAVDSNVSNGTTVDTGVAVYTDTFEGATGTPPWFLPRNGVQMVDYMRAAVVPGVSYAGSNSLRLQFDAQPPGGDGYAAIWYSMPSRREWWVDYYILIPSNYIHRNDGANNNKWLAFYAEPYGSPGFHVNWSLERTSDTTSRLSAHRYNNGAEISVLSGPQLIGPSDLGQWMRVTAMVRTASAEGVSDGAMHFWKNGVPLWKLDDQPIFGKFGGGNTINRCWFMNWANSGYLNTTYFHLDNIRFAQTNVFGVT